MFEEHYVNFCKALQDFIDGKTDKPSWLKQHGLCCNFYYYLVDLGLPEDEILGLEKEQSSYYLLKFGEDAYPFNKLGFYGMSYQAEVRAKAVYQNKKRLAHIRAVAYKGLHYVS